MDGQKDGNLCALCLTRPANKTNTHYLTDGIIRSCLNEDGLDGNKNRERGLYFNLSDDSMFNDFNFQRATSPEKVEEMLGREATDEEIEKAKSEIPFSVDYVFCSYCEDIFTSIEGRFMANIVPKFRDDNDIGEYTEDDFESEDEIKLIRLFFLMQVWRSSICIDLFNISETVKEDLRRLIFDNFDSDLQELKKYPLSIAYLETPYIENEEGELIRAFTENCVGAAAFRNPNIIFMNDFVIQFYEKEEGIKYERVYGLNYPDDFKEFINVAEEEFTIQIFTSKKRKSYLKAIHEEHTVPKRKEFYRAKFIEAWRRFFGKRPSKRTLERYMDGLIHTKGIPMAQKWGVDRIVNYTAEFILKYNPNV